MAIIDKLKRASETKNYMADIQLPNLETDIRTSAKKMMESRNHTNETVKLLK
jgi:hypothetical protein